MGDIDLEKQELARRIDILEKQVKQLETEFRQYRVQFYDRLNKDPLEKRVNKLEERINAARS